MSEPSSTPPVGEPSPSHGSHPAPDQERRLQVIALALSGLAGLAAGIPIIGYLLSPLGHSPELPDEKKWLPVGPVKNFPLGQTRLHLFTNPIQQPWDGMTAHTGLYVRYKGKDARGQDDFLVLAVNCAHLGCPVSWFQQSGLFMCPCHGGAYYQDGSRASGPPPTGLFHYDWRVEKGNLEVRPPHFPTIHDPLNPNNPNA